MAGKAEIDEARLPWEEWAAGGELPAGPLPPAAA